MIESASLRPLTTTALLDAAVEHVRDDPRLYYGIVLPVAGPLAVASLYLLDLCTDYRGPAAGYTTRLVGAAVALALLLHLRPVAQGALTHALASRLEGRPAGVGESFRIALARSVGLAFAGAVFWWSFVLGLFATVIPALVLVPILLLQVPVQVIEGRPAFSATLRAASLGRLELLRAWAITLVLGVALVFGAAGIGLSAQGLLRLARLVAVVDTAYLERVVSWTNPPFVLATLLAAHAVLEPVKGAAHALLYFDRRVRNEGFDLRGKVARLVAETGGATGAPAEGAGARAGAAP